MLWNLPKITTFSYEVIFLFHENIFFNRNNDIDFAKCALFYLLLFYTLSFLILYRSFSEIIPFLFWFYIFGKTSFNTLRFIKYIKYWYGLPLRMSYIMGIFKRWRYYLFSGHSIFFSSMAFMRYYKIEMVPNFMLILTFILILTSCLTPYGFSLYFFITL